MAPSLPVSLFTPVGLTYSAPPSRRSLGEGGPKTQTPSGRLPRRRFLVLGCVDSSRSDGGPASAFCGMSAEFQFFRRAPSQRLQFDRRLPRMFRHRLEERTAAVLERRARARAHSGEHVLRDHQALQLGIELVLFRLGDSLPTSRRLSFVSARQGRANLVEMKAGGLRQLDDGEPLEYRLFVHALAADARRLRQQPAEFVVADRRHTQSRLCRDLSDGEHSSRPLDLNSTSTSSLRHANAADHNAGHRTFRRLAHLLQHLGAVRRNRGRSLRPLGVYALLPRRPAVLLGHRRNGAARRRGVPLPAIASQKNLTPRIAPTTAPIGAPIRKPLKPGSSQPPQSPSIAAPM